MRFNGKGREEKRGKLTAVPLKKASTILPSFWASSTSNIVYVLSTISRGSISEGRALEDGDRRSWARSRTLRRVTPSRISFSVRGAVRSWRAWDLGSRSWWVVRV